MTSRYQIQKACRSTGEFEDIFKASFTDKSEATNMADHWSSKNPSCAWGVRVIDTMDDSVVWED